MGQRAAIFRRIAEAAAMVGEHRRIGAEEAEQFAEMKGRGNACRAPHPRPPARVRALAGPVIGTWVSEREQRLVSQFWLEPPSQLVAMGLEPCLTAVNQHAAALLVVPVGGLVPGFSCTRCGALSSTGESCPDGPAAARAVPDLFEEMVVRTLNDSGQVEAVRDPPGEVAARLRFPPAEPE